MSTAYQMLKRAAVQQELQSSSGFLAGSRAQQADRWVAWNAVSRPEPATRAPLAAPPAPPAEPLRSAPPQPAPSQSDDTSTIQPMSRRNPTIYRELMQKHDRMSQRHLTK